MPGPDTETIRIPASGLRRFTAQALAGNGLPEGDAEIVAEMMVEADLLGADAHGVFRLPRYIDRLKAGGYNRTPAIRIDKSKGGLARHRRRRSHGPSRRASLCRRGDGACACAWGFLGRMPQFQSCGRCRCLGDAACGKGYDRNLHGRWQRQPHGPLGRHRGAFVYQPDRDRCARGRGAGLCS